MSPQPGSRRASNKLAQPPCVPPCGQQVRQGRGAGSVPSLHSLLYKGGSYELGSCCGAPPSSTSFPLGSRSYRVRRSFPRSFPRSKPGQPHSSPEPPKPRSQAGPNDSMALTALFLLAAAQLASAHFGLEYPQWRADTLKNKTFSQWTYPCTKTPRSAPWEGTDKNADLGAQAPACPSVSRAATVRTGPPRAAP